MILDSTLLRFGCDICMMAGYCLENYGSLRRWKLTGRSGAQERGTQGWPLLLSHFCAMINWDVKHPLHIPQSHQAFPTMIDRNHQTMSPSRSPPLVAPIRYLTTVMRTVMSACVPVVLRGGAFGKTVGLNEDMRVMFMMALVALYKEGKQSELVHWFCLTTQ